MLDKFPFEELPLELLTKLLILLKNSKYYSFLSQINKPMHQILASKKTSWQSMHYWKELYQHDFEKPVPPGTKNFQMLYQKALEEWRKQNSHLTAEQRMLFRNIKSDDVESVRLMHVNANDFYFIEDHDHCRLVSLAGMKQAKRISQYVFEQSCHQFLGKKDKDYLGRSRIHFAAACGITLEIMNYPDEVDRVDGKGIPPLLHAVNYGIDEAVNTLIALRANVNFARAGEGETPLYTAAHRGYLNIVKALILAGAYVNTPRASGATPLYIAVQKQYHQIAKNLLEAGADSNLAQNTGITPLYAAVNNHDIELVQELIKYGAKIGTTYTDGITVLYIAARNNCLEIVNALIKARANVNVTRSNGETPLYIASQMGHGEVVHALLENGADMSLATRSGKTPLDIAKENNQAEIFTLLTMWQVKLERNNCSLQEQVIYILKAPTKIENVFCSAINACSSFFSKNPLTAFIDYLTNHNKKDDIKFLMQALKDNYAVIPPEKYDFIFRFVVRSSELNPLPSLINNSIEMSPFTIH